MPEIARGSTRSPWMENWSWERLWICRKADCGMVSQACLSLTVPLLTVRSLSANAVTVIFPSLSCPVQLNNARGPISGCRCHVYRELHSSHYTWHSCCVWLVTSRQVPDRLRILVFCTVRGTHFPVQVCPR
jgi:hypothetical protein